MWYANFLLLEASSDFDRQFISVTNYDNPASLACQSARIAIILCPLPFLPVVSWSIPFTACATSVVAIFTQFFLGHRYAPDDFVSSIINSRNSVFLLTKNKPLVGVIGVLSLLGFIFGMYAGIRSGIIHA